MITSQTHYLIRSKVDGQYLAARPRSDTEDSDRPAPSYLLMFKEHADALSYLNMHGAAVADRFAVELLTDVDTQRIRAHRTRRRARDRHDIAQDRLGVLGITYEPT